jgi:predicted GIY-YIG superfamily endonuclease
MTFTIYLLLLDDFSRYVGVTGNLQKRIEAHRRGWGSIHTRGKKIVIVEEAFTFECENVWQARLREYDYAQRKRVEHGRWAVRGGELQSKKVKEFQRKALIGR